MTATANLAVTKIDSAQAQKEVTANQAFDIFDAALSEIDITMTDANYTLSTSTIPQEWQYGIIKLSGTLTANRNVIVPTNKKEYTVVNATSGGHSIVFKTSSGSGITVTNGDTAKVRCDGTNVVAIVSGSGGGGTYAGISSNNAFTKSQSVTFASLTDGATISVDASLSNNFRVTLGGNRTLANPTNLADGMVLNFYIKQDGTGSRTLSYGNKYKFFGSTSALSTTASSRDMISCIYDATDDVLLCNLVKAAA